MTQIIIKIFNISGAEAWLERGKGPRLKFKLKFDLFYKVVPWIPPKGSCQKVRTNVAQEGMDLIGMHDAQLFRKQKLIKLNKIYVRQRKKFLDFFSKKIGRE